MLTTREAKSLTKKLEKVRALENKASQLQDKAQTLRLQIQDKMGWSVFEYYQNVGVILGKNTGRSK